MPPTTTGMKTPNVNYRLDCRPPSPVGASAKVRQAVPAPHVGAMHADSEKAASAQGSDAASRQVDGRRNEVAEKSRRTDAEAEAKAAKSFEDITRALSNLDRGTSANEEPEIHRERSLRHFRYLGVGHEATRGSAPVSPPEKKPRREESPFPNKFTSPNTSVAVEKKNAATGKGDILEKKISCLGKG